jgi:hypothetical protein
VSDGEVVLQPCICWLISAMSSGTGLKHCRLLVSACRLRLSQIHSLGLFLVDRHLKLSLQGPLSRSSSAIARPTVSGEGR